MGFFCDTEQFMTDAHFENHLSFSPVSVERTLREFESDSPSRALQYPESSRTTVPTEGRASRRPSVLRHDSIPTIECASASQMFYACSSRSQAIPLPPLGEVPAQGNNAAPESDDMPIKRLRIAAADEVSTDKTAARHRCDICSSSFPARKTLNRHVKSVHSSSRFHCAVCSKIFRRKDIKDRHEAEQHGDRSEHVECTACGSQIRERAFKEHLASQKCLAARDVSRVQDATQGPQKPLDYVSAFALALHLLATRIRLDHDLRLQRGPGKHQPGLVESLPTLDLKQRLLERLRHSLADPAHAKSSDILGAVAGAGLHDGAYHKEVPNPHVDIFSRLLSLHGDEGEHLASAIVEKLAWELSHKQEHYRSIERLKEFAYMFSRVFRVEIKIRGQPI